MVTTLLAAKEIRRSSPCWVRGYTALDPDTAGRCSSPKGATATTSTVAGVTDPLMPSSLFGPFRGIVVFHPCSPLLVRSIVFGELMRVRKELVHVPLRGELSLDLILQPKCHVGNATFILIVKMSIEESFGQITRNVGAASTALGDILTLAVMDGLSPPRYDDGLFRSHA